MANNWWQTHKNDQYVKKAQSTKVRSRAWFKLAAIDKKYQVFTRGCRVVDLGAAPGSWSEYARKAIGHNGKIFAVDLLPIQPIDGVHIIQGDVKDVAIHSQLRQYIGGDSDVIMSDIAPNLTGIQVGDQQAMLELLENMLLITAINLAPNGVFICKLLYGHSYDECIKLLHPHFTMIRTFKPDASRAKSREIYVVSSKPKRR